MNTSEKSMNLLKQNTPFLSVKDLCVEFSSDGQIVHAVNSVSFDLEKGKTLALVGETGAGKTTIAKSIIGVLPDTSCKVTNGEIFLEGKDLLKTSESEMRTVRGEKISMVFQDPMTALNPTMKIGNQISEVIQTHDNVSHNEAKERAIEMLELVGIPSERYNEYPHQFSGGMKQRVVIAIALACHPDLLLADEPTTALDVTIQAQILEIIKRLKEENNTSMILITHDLGVVAETSDYVAVIYAGEVIEYGSLEEIFDYPTHPYTIGLFGALPNMNRDAKRLSPIGGLPPDPTNLPDGCSFSPRCPYVNDMCCKNKIPMTNIHNGHLCRCCRVDSIHKKEE